MAGLRNSHVTQLFAELRVEDMGDEILVTSREM